ncbi:MAG: hypothetical protein KDK60_04145 [Chlamydiia bacterium]|nr:hypothetical protein [Chlamydiia bacterium]
MAYRGRALYNLLQMNLKQNPSLEVESWQVEDYRTLSLEGLFERLEALEIFLDKDHFLLYVEECDSPQELADCLCLEKNFNKHEQAFLAVFELWRRLSPHKQSLSLFVDHLDHLIEEYEEGNLEEEEGLQSALESFQRILDDNVDEGGEPEEGYELFSTYSCHDLEVFIYEYIAHQIDAENRQYASELLGGFYPYVKNKGWFDLLSVRLVSEADPIEGKVMLERHLNSLREEPDLYLLFETLHYLIHTEETEDFWRGYQQALEELATEEDLRELLLLTAEYFSAEEKEKEEAYIEKLIDQQKKNDPKAPIGKESGCLEELKQLITTLLKSDQSLDSLQR